MTCFDCCSESCCSWHRSSPEPPHYCSSSSQPNHYPQPTNGRHDYSAYRTGKSCTELACLRDSARPTCVTKVNSNAKAPHSKYCTLLVLFGGTFGRVSDGSSGWHRLANYRCASTALTLCYFRKWNCRRVKNSSFFMRF